jgi:branched-chain amino acid transport system permease protein
VALVRLVSWSWPLAAVATLAVAGLTLDPYLLPLGNQILFFAIAALGYNLLFGNAGQISIGSAAFLGVGAFTAVGATLGLGLPFPVAVLAGGLASAVLGVAIGIPSLRLSSHYLIFGTLALHFIVLYALAEIQREPTGWSLPNASLGGIVLGTDPRRWFLFNGVLAVAVLWIVRNLLERRPGRAWTAVREHPAAAAIMGVDVVFWRLAAFGFSSFLFGVVGALTAFYFRHVAHEDFTLNQAITYVVVILVGGLGSALGSIAGAVTVVLVPYLLTTLISSGALGGLSAALERQQFNLSVLAYGMLVLVVLLVEPGGIAAVVRRLVGLAERGLRQWPPAARLLPALPAPAAAPVTAVTATPATGAPAASVAGAPAPPITQAPAARAAAGRGGPLLRVEGLEVAYGQAGPAVRSVSLAVPEGSIVTLVGPNGAGKTTTLRAIAGFLPGDRARVSAAAIELGGRDLRGLDPFRVAGLGLAFVPERDKVFRGLSVRENLRLRVPRERLARARAEEELFETFPRLLEIDRRLQAGFLSGGERQMLALAIALAGRPSVLVVDEASLGLAPLAITQLSAALRRLSRERGATLLLAEQNVRMAMELSDEIYVLATGRIVDHGPAAAWSEARFQAAYLGGSAAPTAGLAEPDRVSPA